MEGPDQSAQSFAEAVCLVVERQLKKAHVATITLRLDRTVELVTHPIYLWQEQAEGSSLYEAINNLKKRLEENPPPTPWGFP